MEGDLLKKISLSILRYEDAIIPEKELVDLCGGEDTLKKLLPKLSSNLRRVGLDLVRTNYQGEKIYMLSIPSEGTPLDPELFGKFVCLAVLIQEHGKDFSAEELEEIFPGFEKDFRTLEGEKFLTVEKNGERITLELGPVGKVAIKDAKPALTIQNLFKWTS
ncbi:MAG: hypothetical protein ACTSU5_20995 [Promethearchaeota archaeon]